MNSIQRVRFLKLGRNFENVAENLKRFLKGEYLKRENEPLPVSCHRVILGRRANERSLDAPVFYVRELLAT